MDEVGTGLAGHEGFTFDMERRLTWFGSWDCSIGGRDASNRSTPKLQVHGLPVHFPVFYVALDEFCRVWLCGELMHRIAVPVEEVTQGMLVLVSQAGEDSNASVVVTALLFGRKGELRQ